MLHVNEAFRNYNPRSPGYATAIDWIGEIWSDFDPEIIKKSFECTGIAGHRQADLHDPLRKIITTNNMMHDYVEVISDDEDADIHFGDITSSDISMNQADSEEDQ
jgi:hypothetical protein